MEAFEEMYISQLPDLNQWPFPEFARDEKEMSSTIQRLDSSPN
jgi:hypothetical protein